MRKMRHPNIIRLHEVLHDDSNDTIYLVLNYADFGALDRLCCPDTDVLRSVFAQILSAVSYLNSHGIVHQDIKPSNILLTADGRAFLSDFGVGHSFHSAAMVVGSPGYQAPEALADDDADASPALEDVWSLGVAFYQSLFARLPFEGDTVFEIIHRIQSQPLEIPDGTDPAIARLLSGMLTVDPRRRMTIDEIRRAEFFRDARIRPIGTAKPADVILEGREVVRVTVVVCDVNYSFARPCLEQEATWTALAPSWTCRFNDSVVQPAFVGSCFRAVKMRPFNWKRCCK
jgi:serine/threonine-protein kinase 11